VASSNFPFRFRPGIRVGGATLRRPGVCQGSGRHPVTVSLRSAPTRGECCRATSYALPFEVSNILQSRQVRPAGMSYLQFQGRCLRAEASPKDQEALASATIPSRRSSASEIP